MLDFPAAPADGQVFQAGNGARYRYQAPPGLWTVDAMPTGGGSGVPVVTSDTPPSTPSDGDLWWDSTLGKLFVWFDDPSPDAGQWVPATPASGGGGASVSTSDTPPSTPSDGDLWWDSTAGSLFVYYDDGSSLQWVAASPTGGSGAAVSVALYGASPAASAAVNSAAITAALAVNRSVYVPAGIYNVETQYDGTPSSGGVTRRICIRVPADREIFGPGTLQYTTPQPTVVPNRLVAILSIVGSNVRIRGLTFNDAHNSLVIPPATYGSVCRASGIVCGDGEDPSVTYAIENVVIGDCTFTNNFYPVFFRVASLSATTISDFKIMNCRGIAHPLAGFSGGFTTFGMNPWLDITKAPIRNGVMAFNLMRGTKTSAGMEFAGQYGGIMLGNVCEDCGYAGFETEGGAEEITFVGNRAIRCGDPLWVHDSSRVALVGNIVNVTPQPQTPGGANVQHGIFISRGGVDGVASYAVDEIVVSGNIVKDGGIAAGTYGAGGGTFGSITVIGNDVQQRPASVDTAMSMGSAVSKTVIGNMLKGGLTTTMSFSAGIAEPMMVVGNVTMANPSEASAGITITGTPNLAYGFNDFVNGVGGIATHYARFGNRDAGNTQMLSQAGHYLSYGTANPETVVTGTSADLFQRSDGNPIVLYVKVGSGTTGWRGAQLLQSGDTASRPAISAGQIVGYRYFDTTLGKPVWWNGSVWKDATGATV